MNFLLDTCFLSELSRPRPDPGVTRWQSRREPQTLFVSCLTIGEIQSGIAVLPEGRRRLRLQDWLDGDVRPAFASRVLPVDVRIAETWGRIKGEAIRRGETPAPIDSLMAATAIIHGLVVVTRNTRDFELCRAEVFNPWSA